MTNWYIGQEIIAIKNSKCGKIKKNQHFTILGIKRHTCKCYDIVLDVGINKKPPTASNKEQCA